MRATVVGDRELIQKLQSLRKVKAKAAIRKGSRAGSKVVVPRAISNAPVRTGALRQAIKVRALPRSRRWTGTNVTMTIYYGSFVELGTKRIKARRFIRDAMDEARSAATSTFIQGIKDNINVA